MFKNIITNIINYPNNNAFCIADKLYTYEELGARIAEIQQEINKLRSKQPIAIIYDDNFDSYVSILSVLLLGKTYVPINPNNPIERNNKIIKNINPILILNTTSNKYFYLSSELLTNNIMHTNKSIVYNTSKSEIAYIFFTSGSTGEPKGVPISYGNLSSFINAVDILNFDISSDDRFLQMFELTFDLSVFSYLYPLTIGASVYTIPNTGLKYGEVLKVLTKKEITFALMVPSIINSLKSYFKQINLPKLKYSLFCGEALLKDNAIGWKHCSQNNKLYNVYGPTEATIFCTSYELNENTKEYNGIVSIGKAMSNTVLTIDSKETKGELILSGEQVAKEYFKNKDKTNECFFSRNGNNSYKTGDICFADDEGDFFYVGRTDSQVQIQGFRVELLEIENVISSEYSINSTVITIENDTRIIAFVEGVVDSEIIINKLKSLLPHYMIPKKIINLKKLPLNTNGKVDKNKLREYAKSKI